MDDTFIIFKDQNNAEAFLNYINNQHPKIKFTMETERENKLSFLDILISKNGNKLDTSIYRKETFSGLGVNFLSRCFIQFKYNTFSTMFYRAYRLTSTYEAFHNEITFLKKFFTNNGFPENIFYSKVKKFLEQIYHPKQKMIGPKKQDLYIKFPFLDDKTNIYFRTAVKKILSKYFPQINIKIIFFNNYKIKAFVNHKEKLPSAYESLIIYRFFMS